MEYFELNLGNNGALTDTLNTNTLHSLNGTPIAGNDGTPAQLTSTASTKPIPA
jgi:hypothetical protein